jgi:hypothetical protein
MVAKRSIVATVLVWATALSTAMGNLPHFVCRCTQGPIANVAKKKCATDCCCGDGCCKSCCQKSAEKETAKSPDHFLPQGPEWTASPCQKALAPANESWALAKEKASHTILLCLHILPTTAGAAPSLAPVSWCACEVPPPTDLVTVLQRLLI